VASIIAILAAVLAATGGMLAISLSRGQKLSKEGKAAIKISEDLITLQARGQKIQKEAKDAKTALAKTPDRALIHRANSLFS